MGGVTGFLTLSGTHQPDKISRMLDALAHRGPDDSGQWDDVEIGVVLGQCLATSSSSTMERLPMVSASGRYVITIDGSIYNHSELRAGLEAASQPPTWAGQSVAETLLAAFDAWGIEHSLTSASGAFALGVWDRERQELTLVRDRLGERPLYYGWQRDSFLFGSELSALREHPRFKGEIDRDALNLFLRYSAVPDPYSIYQDIKKLNPGTMLTVSKRDTDVCPRQWWSFADMAASGIANPFSGTADDAVQALEQTLSSAVADQSAANQSHGAFLSGGVDSSTIAALLQSQSSTPVATFSVGFDDQAYDESAHAAAVARHLGTDHTEIKVTPEDALSLIPKLPQIYNEPFADSSQLPTTATANLQRTFRRLVPIANDVAGTNDTAKCSCRTFGGRRR